MKRVIVTPNVEVTEETLDMSCFLSGVDREISDEEIPELVDEEEAVDDEEDINNEDNLDDEELLA